VTKASVEELDSKMVSLDRHALSDFRVRLREVVTKASSSSNPQEVTCHGCCYCDWLVPGAIAASMSALVSSLEKLTVSPQRMSCLRVQVGESGIEVGVGAGDGGSE
jgi:hypothetical protein